MRLTCSGKYFDFRLQCNFFIENQNTVDHPAEQILIKEENNWFLKIPLLKNLQAHLFKEIPNVH